MDKEFDKEMHILLREAARSSFPNVEFDSHPGADEIAAFTENSVPEKHRKILVSHFADCNRCRNILSATISIDQDEIKEVSSAGNVASLASKEAPWYRSIFSSRNLLLGTSAAVILIVAGIGFTLFNRQNADVAKAPELGVAESDHRRARGENSNADSEREANSPEPFAESADSNHVEPIDSGSIVENPAKDFELERESTRARGPNSVDGKIPVVRDNSSELPKDVKESAKSESRPVLESVPPSAGAMREGNEKFRAAAEKNEATPNLAPQSMAAKIRTEEGVPGAQDSSQRRASAKKSVVADSKLVGGKTFTKKGAIWYDSAYSGQATKTIKRGSDEYKKLPSSLRSIVSSLNGSTIIVIGSKAFLIQ